MISGTISPGNLASQLPQLFDRGAFQWIQTPQTFDELQRVLSREEFSRDYGLREEDIREFLDTLLSSAEFVTPLPLIDLPIHSRDEKDDIFLACAFGGSCDYLVTGDQDLLILKSRKELGNMEIVTVREFLERSGYLEKVKQ